jgi:hypothetical protein
VCATASRFSSISESASPVARGAGTRDRYGERDDGNAKDRKPLATSTRAHEQHPRRRRLRRHSRPSRRTLARRPNLTFAWHVSTLRSVPVRSPSALTALVLLVVCGCSGGRISNAVKPAASSDHRIVLARSIGGVRLSESRGSVERYLREGAGLRRATETITVRGAFDTYYPTSRLRVTYIPCAQRVCVVAVETSAARYRTDAGAHAGGDGKAVARLMGRLPGAFGTIHQGRSNAYLSLGYHLGRSGTTFLEQVTDGRIEITAVAVATALTYWNVRPATPIGLAKAKTAFARRGFEFLANLAVNHQTGVVENNAVIGGTIDAGASIGLTVYRSPSVAERATAPSPKRFHGPYDYRVANVVLVIDPSTRASTRKLLLDALRTLGTPIHIR